MLGLNIVCRVAFVILVCVTSITCASSPVLNFSDAYCGKHYQSRVMRIVGGMQAELGEFPWIVSIRYCGIHTCGGVIVNKKWVITAAHCFCSGSSIDTENKFDVTVNRDGLRNMSSQSIKISRRVVHPGYVCSRLKDDIVLLELAEEISWANADPACFPIDEEPYTNLSHVKAVAVGWGATNEDLSLGSIPWRLHKVQVPILQNHECQRWYESQNKSLRLHKSQMCAGYKSGKKDTCWADSGGPLMVRKGTYMVVVGLVSTGIGCARVSLPGIYTRLSEYVDWIGDVVR